MKRIFILAFVITYFSSLLITSTATAQNQGQLTLEEFAKEVGVSPEKVKTQYEMLCAGATITVNGKKFSPETYGFKKDPTKMKELYEKQKAQAEERIAAQKREEEERVAKEREALRRKQEEERKASQQKNTPIKKQENTSGIPDWVYNYNWVRTTTVIGSRNVPGSRDFIIKLVDPSVVSEQVFNITIINKSPLQADCWTRKERGTFTYSNDGTIVLQYGSEKTVLYVDYEERCLKFKQNGERLKSQEPYYY